MSRTIVVDTSVARACGRGHIRANSPAPQCVAALAAMADGNMRTAMSAALKKEWDTHAGEYAKKWLGNMIARKRFSMVRAPWDGESSVEDEAQGLPEKKRQAVLKDLHLVSLAMLTDRRVLSLDDSQRELLSLIVSKVISLRKLHWVNPKGAETQRWLLEGACDQQSFCIKAD